jgi:hypothetical protein
MVCTNVNADSWLYNCEDFVAIENMRSRPSSVPTYSLFISGSYARHLGVPFASFIVPPCITSPCYKLNILIIRSSPALINNPRYESISLAIIFVLCTFTFDYNLTSISNLSVYSLFSKNSDYCTLLSCISSESSGSFSVY